MHDFIFDKSKSLTNKTKYGIDFNEAQRIWEDVDRLVIPAKVVDEARYLIIGKIKNKYWSAIYSLRDDKIRIISVRRSRKKEIYIYES